MAERDQDMGHAMGRVRRIHFIGIGGAGMGGIAEVLHNLGYDISGSDLQQNAMARHLAACGVQVYTGHAAAHIRGADVVVYSSAVPADNPEMMEARRLRLPVVPRAQMLAELMRFRSGIAVAGTHGKTTTTSLIANLLAEGGLDPTFVVGGRVISSGTHAKLGQGKYLVAEADESDASFLHLSPVMAVVTNIDLDHMETYGGDPQRLRAAFLEFLHRLPFYGLAVLCMDDPVVRGMLDEVGRPVVTYGTDPRADIRAGDIQQQGMMTRFSVVRPGEAQWLSVALNLPGRHNVLNALAAIAVARELNVSDAALLKGLREFQGISRRFQNVGELKIGKARVTLIDDYGHHPTEMAATLAALRAGWPGRRVVMVFQPHRYTRTRDLLDDFARVLSEVDQLLLLDVYAAGEPPLPGADSRALARALRARGKVDPILVAAPAEVPALLPGIMRDGDVLLVQGAGNIGATVVRLQEQFASTPLKAVTNT
ncbi:MAG TPA: UDP-N-acetylmuramate--L-alanine ligase [Gammaproteobacteria bacterium]|nr:UDP-N-acetylmuramate--L-alanine ligase [Gammaproteobacteria bacterium]